MGETVILETPRAPLRERVINTIVGRRRIENGLSSTSTHPEFQKTQADERLADAVLEQVLLRPDQPPQTAFDLLEGIAADMEADGRPAFATNLRAGFARGTGGIDSAWLRELIVSGLREARYA